MVKAVDHVIRNPIAGILHLTNNEPISKCALLELFAEIWGKDDVIIEHDGRSVADRSLLCSRKDFRHVVPSYRVMLEELHAFMLDHRDLYGAYLR